MSNENLITGFLSENHSEEYCDDCLSKELNIYPRQQVNQICNRLLNQAKITRREGNCSLCQKAKITNSIQKEDQFKIEPAILKDQVLGHEVDILKIRKEMVQICQEILNKDHKEVKIESLVDCINQLKNENKIPYHQANMMITLCLLRNGFMYDGLQMGERENSIAMNAWSIVQDWWLGQK